jgi:HPt (histidine-containing phosphotransfer) domain-containing protein
LLPASPLKPDVTVEVFDLATALTRVNGDRKMLERFLRMFRERNAGIVDEIGVALAGQQPESARRLAHSLKGGAGTIGMVELEAAAARMEAMLAGTMGRKNDPTSYHDDFAALEAAWARSQEALITLLASATSQT